MESVRIKAYAKVNLTLAVTGSDGTYHTIDSIVASVDLYDLIVIKKRKDRLSYLHYARLGQRKYSV